MDSTTQRYWWDWAWVGTAVAAFFDYVPELAGLAALIFTCLSIYKLLREIRRGR